jgi:hypothetical protein
MWQKYVLCSINRQVIYIKKHPKEEPPEARITTYQEARVKLC